MNDGQLQSKCSKTSPDCAALIVRDKSRSAGAKPQPDTKKRIVWRELALLRGFNETQDEKPGVFRNYEDRGLTRLPWLEK